MHSLDLGEFLTLLVYLQLYYLSTMALLLIGVFRLNTLMQQKQVRTVATLCQNRVANKTAFSR